MPCQSRFPHPSLRQFPTGPQRMECLTRAGVWAAEGAQEVRGHRNPARPGLIRTCAPGANQRRGRAASPRHPRRRTPHAIRPSRLPAAAGMSSTQFNKGPSYGLSAEVKNRVSEGRSDPACGGLAPSDFCRGGRPARLPDIWGIVALRPETIVTLLFPNIWGSGGVSRGSLNSREQ